MRLLDEDETKLVIQHQKITMTFSDLMDPGDGICRLLVPQEKQEEFSYDFRWVRDAQCSWIVACIKTEQGRYVFLDESRLTDGFWRFVDLPDMEELLRHQTFSF